MLPTVETKGSTIQATGTVKAVEQTTVVTNTDIQTALTAIAEHSLASKAEAKTKAEKSAALSVVFGKLLGIKSMDEIVNMDEAAVGKLMKERYDAKQFTFEEGFNALFNICTSKSEVRPAWKDEFVKLNGEAKALEVTKNTPKSFYYTIKPKA